MSDHLPEYVFCRVCGMAPVKPGKCHAEYGAVPEPCWHKAADVEAALRACELLGWSGISR